MSKPCDGCGVVRPPLVSYDLCPMCGYGVEHNKTPAGAAWDAVIKRLKETEAVLKDMCSAHADYCNCAGCELMFRKEKPNG